MLMPICIRLQAIDYLLLKYLAQADLRVTHELVALVDNYRLYDGVPATLQSDESYLNLLVAIALR